MMRADYSAVDHLQGVRNSPALLQSLQYILAKPGQGPSFELFVNARPFAEFFGQIPPRRTCPRDPENTIQNKAVIDWFAAI